MTVKLSRFLASTFLCVSTFSLPCLEAGWAMPQETGSNSTLEALLNSPARPATTAHVKRVTYAQDDRSGPLQPLLPPLPTPPSSRPTPLLPSIAQPDRNVPVVSGNAPIVQALPAAPTPRNTPTTSKSIPVIPGGTQRPSANGPIVSGPLTRDTASGPAITYPSIPAKPTPVVPVVDGQTIRRPAATNPTMESSIPIVSGNQPETQANGGRSIPVVPNADPIVSQPIQEPATSRKPIVAVSPIKTETITRGSTARPTIQEAIQRQAENSGTIAKSPESAPIPPASSQNLAVDPITETGQSDPIIAASKTPTRKSQIQAQASPKVTPANSASTTPAESPIVATPKTGIDQTPASAASQDKTLEQAILAAQSEITGDEIKVEEVSTEELMKMIMGPARIKAQPTSTAIPQSTQERIETIGTGAQGEGTAPMMEMTHPQDVFAQSDTPYVQAPLDTGYGYDAVRPQAPSCLPYDGCGCVSGATGYAFLDFLYMDRDKGDFSASFLPSDDSYDFTPGARIRIGRKYDSIEGWEASFTMLDAFTSNSQIASPTNSLFTNLIPIDGFTPASLSSFNGASFHENFQKSHFYSAEWNKMSYNWDVMSSFIGIRATSIDDLYGLNSIGGGGSFGTYRLRARNFLIGPQIGGELFYDIGRRLSFSMSGKLGGYLNFYQTNTEFANANLLIMDNTDEDVDFSWSAEMGFFARYMLTPRAKLKLGYEFWYFDNVASAQGQYNGLLSPYSGLNSSNSDDAVYHGASFGLEWYR